MKLSPTNGRVIGKRVNIQKKVNHDLYLPHVEGKFEPLSWAVNIDPNCPENKKLFMYLTGAGFTIPQSNGKPTLVVIAERDIVGVGQLDSDEEAIDFETQKPVQMEGSEWLNDPSR